MSDNIIKDITGPISKKYCVYFYALMVFFIFTLIFSVVVFVFTLFSKNVSAFIILGALSNVIIHGVLYLNARLMHNMCMGTMI